MAYRLIDLFSGAGGLTLGFSRRSGREFSPVWANDMDPDAAASYNLNFGDHCVVGAIDRLLEDSDVQTPKADIVIGGPPCQGFSLLNKNRRNDPRKQLWRPFLDVTTRSRAGVFVMENVSSYPRNLGTSRDHRRRGSDGFSRQPREFFLPATTACPRTVGGLSSSGADSPIRGSVFHRRKSVSIPITGLSLRRAIMSANRGRGERFATPSATCRNRRARRCAKFRRRLICTSAGPRPRKAACGIEPSPKKG